jgi:hypothetical protein
MERHAAPPDWVSYVSKALATFNPKPEANVQAFSEKLIEHQVGVQLAPTRSLASKHKRVMAIILWLDRLRSSGAPEH